MNTVAGRTAAWVSSVSLLAGCATFSPDGGFGTVQSEAATHAGLQAEWHRDSADRMAAREEVARLLAEPLTVESAMQIALLNNPRLQAGYARLGLSEAERVRAGRLPNPGFSYSRISGGGAVEIGKGLHFDLLALLTMPKRVEIASRQFEAAKLQAASMTLDTALAAKAAFINAVWAEQTVAYYRQVVGAAEASHDLMRRMRAVGNASQLDLDRERLFSAEAHAALARAVKRAGEAREALTRTLGLWGDQLAYRLPEQLPDLPPAPRRLENIERQAVEQRLDIRRARLVVEGLGSHLDLSKATRFINVLEVGAEQERERGEAPLEGYEIAIEVPLFDLGQTRLAMAEARFAEATQDLRAAAVDARSEVREAYLGYRSSYDIARHYRDEIVPLRRRISDEQLLRYNGMLISVFELIADARDQVASVSAYLEALRDYWLADTSLSRAMVVGGRAGGIPSASASLPTANTAADAH